SWCQELGCLEVPTLLISACWYLLAPMSAASMKADNSESFPISCFRPESSPGEQRIISSSCSSVHSSYSFHCCPQVLIRSKTLASNLELTLPLVHGCSRALISDVFTANPESSCAAGSSHHIFPFPRRFIRRLCMPVTMTTSSK